MTAVLDDFAKQHFVQNQSSEFEYSVDTLSQRRHSKVCLKNLPKCLNENGLRNLCGQYGETKLVLFWKDRNYAFVTYGSLSEAENAIRKINANNTLGIKADFAFDNKNNKTATKDQIREELRLMIQEPNFDANIDWNERKVRGPFSQPQRIPDDFNKIKSCATDEDYCQSGALYKADPHKEFINQMRNNSSAEFAELKRRIVNGRSVHIKNDVLWQKFKEKSKSSFGSYDVSKATYSFRSKHLPVALAPCSKCNEPSCQYCRKCDAPFCSMICEANDEIHKQTCANEKVYDFNDAVDVNHTNEDKDEIESKWIQKSNTKVKLMCFVDFKTVYVRPSNAGDEIEFIKLLNDVAKAAKTSPKMESPTSGCLALAPFEMNYQRVLILKLLNEHEAIVAFLDFGNVDTANIADLKMMPLELKKMPRMVTKFILKNVPTAMCNDDALKILYNLLNQQIELSVRFDEPYVFGVTECELMQAAIESVNTIINQMNVPWDQFELESGECQYGVQHVEITGENVPVLIVDNSTVCYAQVSVIKAADIDQFQRNDQLIQTIANYLDREGNHITPRSMDLCLAKVDDKWYRVLAIEVRNDRHVTALFIDYGNVDILNIICLRKMPKLLHFPCITATVTCFDTDADVEAVEVRRKKCLPILNILTFVELTHKNQGNVDYDGHCDGILPLDIYNKINETLEPERN